MKFGLIVCTYQRPKSLLRLLDSVKEQLLYPNEIIIVDASLDNRTKHELQGFPMESLNYFKVEEEHRGLTRQRNFGVTRISPDVEVIFFLDDDTLLDPQYFKEVIQTYKNFPEAIGVSGYIINETVWKETELLKEGKNGYFNYDGWSRIEGSRFKLRRILGLAPTAPPGFMPDFSHGYSTGFLPPTGKTYEVEMLMGGIASYKNEVFSRIKFSSFFDGYGLYEDADFSLRASRLGKLYVNTKAKVEHHHAVEGRPDMYKYGKMVVRNGWYVWRIKYPSPSIKGRFKWLATSGLLTLVRLGNIISSGKSKIAFEESLGRISGLISLIFNSPKTS